jgi:hypothetical protein
MLFRKLEGLPTMRRCSPIPSVAAHVILNGDVCHDIPKGKDAFDAIDRCMRSCSCDRKCYPVLLLALAHYIAGQPGSPPREKASESQVQSSLFV